MASENDPGIVQQVSAAVNQLDVWAKALGGVGGALGIGTILQKLLDRSAKRREERSDDRKQLDAQATDLRDSYLREIGRLEAAIDELEAKLTARGRERDRWEALARHWWRCFAGLLERTIKYRHDVATYEQLRASMLTRPDGVPSEIPFPTIGLPKRIPDLEEPELAGDRLDPSHVAGR